MSHKCYDVAFKLRAVAVAEVKSKKAAAAEFKVVGKNSWMVLSKIKTDCAE